MAKVRLNQANIEALARPGGAVYREVDRIGRRVESRAKRNANVDTGRMRSSIRNTMSVRGRRVTATIGTDVEYALYQHEGTGIYGPRHRVITPKRGKFLRFEVSGPVGPRRPGDRGNSNVVYARYVRGTPPNPFLTSALIAVSPWPVIRNPL